MRRQSAPSQRSQTVPGTRNELLHATKKLKADIADPRVILSQPFKIPRPTTPAAVSRRGTTSRRSRTVVNYREDFVDSELGDVGDGTYIDGETVIRDRSKCRLGVRSRVIVHTKTLSGGKNVSTDSITATATKGCSIQQQEQTITVEGIDNANVINSLTTKFLVPIKEFYNDPSMASRPPPAALGTRRQANFVPRPLHDPTAEFAIVLYDPTIDKDIDEEEEKERERKEEEDKNLKENKENTSSNSPEDKKDDLLPSPPPSNPKSARIAQRSQKSIAEILGLDSSDGSNSAKKKKYPNVPVVIDPRLSKVLRPHQVEGVKFLYKCCTGRIVPRAYGCIMADEMGLGKTLQCIALLWTLLKQSPQGSQHATIRKCVIACPSSLVRNWANELDKWLGKGAITPLAIDGGKSGKASGVAKSTIAPSSNRNNGNSANGSSNGNSSSNNSNSNAGAVAAAIRQWANATGRQIVRPVLIISYETLRRNIDDLKNTDIGLLLCDEGHRLKNSDSLTFTALDSLKCKRRVILSGTPIQNDLSEYFSLLNFANPGLLGSRSEFRKNYELDILKGRDADATDEQVKVGSKKLQELSQIVGPLIIRRTNDILSKYLPVKYEHVVFCDLSPFQKSLYNHFISSPEIKRLLRGTGSQPLKAIGLLRKLCTHPDLLDLPSDIEGCEDVLPEEFVPKDMRGRGEREVKTWWSGKLTVLERMLARIRQDTNDKIVLISNFTQTLDIIERMCRTRRYGCLRLDGTLSINKRQKLVDRFNDIENTEDFVFLLSSKAGGCGINLIGANRLILLDPDWNPAADQQALARVWRDGQRKDCFVYRFIATGTIEEKIYQRQSMKQSLSSCVVDEKEDVERLFSLDNLRQLFTFQPNTPCDTHDTFRCKRCRDGKQYVRAPAMLYGDANSWNHFTNQSMEKIEDLLLRQECGNDIVSFVFQYISH